MAALGSPETRSAGPAPGSRRSSDAAPPAITGPAPGWTSATPRGRDPSRSRHPTISPPATRSSRRSRPRSPHYRSPTATYSCSATTRSFHRVRSLGGWRSPSRPPGPGSGAGSSGSARSWTRSTTGRAAWAAPLAGLVPSGTATVGIGAIVVGGLARPGAGAGWSRCRSEALGRARVRPGPGSARRRALAGASCPRRTTPTQGRVPSRWPGRCRVRHRTEDRAGDGSSRGTGGRRTGSGPPAPPRAGRGRWASRGDRSPGEVRLLLGRTEDTLGRPLGP